MSKHDLHTDGYAAQGYPPAVKVLRHDERWRIVTVGYKADGTFHPKWAAVVCFTRSHWLDSFEEVHQRIEAGASLGASFAASGLKWAQNRLSSRTVPVTAVPSWVQTELERDDPEWTEEIYGFFVLDETGKLGLYAYICEFYPGKVKLLEREELGSWLAWKMAGRREIMAAQLISQDVLNEASLSRQDKRGLEMARRMSFPTVLWMRSQARRIRPV